MVLLLVLSGSSSCLRHNKSFATIIQFPVYRETGSTKMLPVLLKPIPRYCTNNQQRTGTPKQADYYKGRPVTIRDSCRHCSQDLRLKPRSGGCPNPASSPGNHLQNCRQGLPCSKSGRGFPLSQTADISRRYWAGKPSRFRGAHRQKIPHALCC